MVVVEEHSCHFHWDIHHPFVPWHKLSATFYDCSPNASRWKVTLEPLIQGINYWRFAFCLEFVPSLDTRGEMAANRVEVDISLNNRHVDGTDDSNVWFRPRNFYTYRFEAEAFSYESLMNPDLLTVTITLHLPGPAAKEYTNIDARNQIDPMWLHRDMLQLLMRPVFSNMRVRSKENETTFRVHSCIIRARWNNFSTCNAIPADPEGVIVMNISSTLLLQYILIFLYSGLSVFRPQSVPQASELFQVVHQYELYHLYKALAKDDLNQRRVTGSSVITESCIFPLAGVLGHPADPWQQFWTLNQNARYQFLFIIKALNCNGPWLSFSLRSRSSILVHVQVNLEIQKKTLGTSRQTTHCVHQRNYIILPAQHVESGAVLSLGSPEIFGDVNRQGQSGEVEYSLRCILKFTDGKTVEHMQSRDTLPRDYLNNVEILGDHLLQLRWTTFEADLRVNAQTEDQHNGELCTYEIHKAIFKARVPDWSRIFQDYDLGVETNDVATLFLRSESLPFVLDYVYSSRVSTILYNFLDDIGRFADTGRCDSLLALVHSIQFGDYFDWTGSP